MSSGQDAWIQTNRPLTVKLIHGDAEIDGHPVPPSTTTTFDAGRPDYFINTWSGCKLSLQYLSPEEKPDVKWIKSSGMFPLLLNCSEYRTLLVVDSGPESAISAANSMYKLHDDPVYLLNIDTRTNCGTAAFYALSGTIPPHHPLDHIPSIKHMFWCGEEGIGPLVTALKDVFEDGDNRIVVFMNYATSSQKDISAVSDTFSFDCCATTSDYVFYASGDILGACGHRIKLPPLLSGVAISPTGCHEGVTRNIFVQQFQPAHFPAGDAHHHPLRAYHRLPDAILPIKTKFDSPLSSYLTRDLTGCGVFAAVSGTDNAVMSFWGFVYVDQNDRCHSLFPRPLLQKHLTLLYAHDIVM